MGPLFFYQEVASASEMRDEIARSLTPCLN
jgi:hypothetical protein